MPDFDLALIEQHDFPTDLLVETTAECNLSCVMCPQQNLSRPRGRMAYDLWTRIVDEVAEVSPETRLWPAFMGEPLLMAPEIFRWLRYAKHQGIEHISLASNLNLLRPDHAESLVLSGLDEIVVGLDAHSVDRYCDIRVGGNLERVRQAVTYLARTKQRLASTTPRLVLQFLVMDENAHEQQSFVDFWQGTGLEVDLEIRPRTGWGGVVTPWPSSSHDGERTPCVSLMRRMVVFWNGLVPQCDSDWNGRTRHGNLNRQSIAEAWHGSLAGVRARHWHGKYHFVPCHDCRDWASRASRTVRCGAPAAAARNV